MADIRIKDLAVTAGSSASDDYLAVDGSTNGTRKLSAYSPTFGGNLTVSGTGTSTFSGRVRTTSNDGFDAIVSSGNTGLGLGSGSQQYSLYLNAADNSLRIYSSPGGDRLAVSSNGNFGIGTISPVTTLNVVKTLGSSGTIANSLLHLGSTGSLGNIYPITFGYSGSSAVNPPAFIGMEITDGNSYTKGALVFGLRDVTTDTLPTERARITSSGSLGIGTTSPASRLHVKDATGTAVTLLTLESAYSNPSGNKSLLWTDGSGNGLGRISISYDATNGSRMSFGSLYNSGHQTSDLMTLANTGNLIIGSPFTDGGQKLQVNGGTKFSDATAEDQFAFYNTATTPTYSSLLRLRQVNTSADPASTYLIYADTQNGASAGLKFSVSENGRVTMPALPTSSAGLPAGSLWNDSGTVKIV